MTHSDIAIEIVEELRPPEDWWKGDLEEAIFDAAVEMLEARFEKEDALIIISKLISATRAEYGE